MTKITRVKIIHIPQNRGHVAMASCVLDEKYFLGGIGVYMKLDGGYRITYPTKKAGHGEANIHHPIVRECGDEIKSRIIEEYKKNIKVYETRYSTTEKPCHVQVD